MEDVAPGETPGGGGDEETSLRQNRVKIHVKAKRADGKVKPRSGTCFSLWGKKKDPCASPKIDPVKCPSNCSKTCEQASEKDKIMALEEAIRQQKECTKKHFQEVLCELCRHKKDMREIRDMLDLSLKMMREHLFMMSAFSSGNDGRYKNAMHDIDNVRQNALERKTNTTSIADQAEGGSKGTIDDLADLDKIAPLEATKITELEAGPPPTKKKKGFFNWCK